jgi:phosphatidylethanolamine-binding protein (PEBP) family uncharacterized protein
MMRSNKLMKAALAGFSLALVVGGCSGSNDNTGAGGTGGASSSQGGTTGTAGTTGVAGTSGQAGTTGNGGAGATGTGGSNATGTAGGTGSGGDAATGTGGGGATGTGGGGGATGGNGGATGGSGVGGGGGAASGGHGGAEGGRGGSGGRGGATGAGGTTGSGGSGTFSLTSPMLMDGAKFDGKYTCNGGSLGAGVNPQLDWTGVPAGTKAFAITFIDTTLGANMSTGQHWAIWNIPYDSSTGKVTTFPEGTTTLSGDLATAMQTNKFLAPCAQSLMNNMDDQYAFTIYALSATLNISGASGTGVANSAGVAKVLAALQGVTPLGTAVLHAHAGLKGK